MGFRLLLVLALVVSPIFVSGCRTPKSKLMDLWANRDKEVKGNVPPRRTGAQQEQSGRATVSLGNPEPATDIELTEFNPSKEYIEFDGATVVAIANSRPIFASDVLEPYALHIAQAAQKLSPEDLNRVKGKIIQEHLTPHVEKAVLVSALEESLDKQALKQLDDQLESLFLDEIERLKKTANVGTRVELQQALDKEGVNLDALKRNFASRQMAMFYIGQNADAKVQYSRKELLSWYNQNRDQYKIDAQARWQQVRISFAKNQGKEGAAEVLRAVVADLRAGKDFGEVAKQFSDGPKKAKGGIWDWTSPDSLSEESVDKALWTSEVGKVSQVLTTDSAFVLVKVLERVDAGYTPFEDVQDKINTKLVNESRTTAADKVVKDLMTSATVWTVFDAQKPANPLP